LDEIQQDEIQHTTIIQKQTMKWYDKFIRNNKFKPGDWDLLFDLMFKFFKEKISTRWLGAYVIETIFYNGSVKIKTINVEGISFLVNGNKQRLYEKHSNREKIVHNFLQQPEMEIVSKGNPSLGLILN
jgi:hypothetical protein